LEGLEAEFGHRELGVLARRAGVRDLLRVGGGAACSSFSSCCILRASIARCWASYHGAPVNAMEACVRHAEGGQSQAFSLLLGTWSFSSLGPYIAFAMAMALAASLFPFGERNVSTAVAGTVGLPPSWCACRPRWPPPILGQQTQSETSPIRGNQLEIRIRETRGPGACLRSAFLWPWGMSRSPWPRAWGAGAPGAAPDTRPPFLPPAHECARHQKWWVGVGRPGVLVWTVPGSECDWPTLTLLRYFAAARGWRGGWGR
jgi:hypothetical protein